MNINLNNYSTPPDLEVWDRIERTLHRRTLLRRITAAAAAVALVAVAAVALWGRTAPDAEAPVVAQLNASEALPTTEVQAPAVAAQPQSSALPLAEQTKAEPKATAMKQAADKRVAETQPVVAASEQAASTVTEIAYQPDMPVMEPIAEPSSQEAPHVATAVVPHSQPIVQPAETVADATAETPQVVKASSNNANDDTILWIPNVFAPGSGNNDINMFRVKMNQPSDHITDYRILIFSRSGQQVYVSHDINGAWDGTFKGRELPQSTYVYVIQYTDHLKIKHQRKGTVTLVR